MTFYEHRSLALRSLDLQAAPISSGRNMMGMGLNMTRWSRIVTVLVVPVFAAGIPATRTPILRAAGWALVASDPIAPADVIVVAVDADGAGVLEAADLVHRGISTRVAIFADPPDGVDRELIRRGIPYDDDAERSARQLMSLGVKTVEQIPGSVTGTEDEGRVLSNWCDEHQINSVVVVSHTDHSRRLRRVLHRSMRSRRIKFMIRTAYYSGFDPDRWWESRNGIRTGIVEFEKLLLDVVRHPIP